MSGLHKSPFKGFSVEFAEHRQYGPGDEIRHIDWRAFGKTDRYYVKEYEEETNLRAYLVVDSSGSMGYAGRTASKFEQARRLAASLAYLMIGQRDAVGLVTFDTAVRAMIPPRSAPGHFSVALLGARADEDRRRGPPERHPARAGRADPPPRPGRDRLRRLRRRRGPGRRPCGTCGIAGTRCCSSTRWPPRRRSSRSADRRGSAAWSAPATTCASIPRPCAPPISSGSTRFCATLKERLHAMGADYHRASTAEPVERTLLDYLSSRSRSRRGG